MSRMKIMNPPMGLNGRIMHHNVNYYKGDYVFGEFYNQRVGYGSIKRNNIPEELEKKGWKPDADKMYKVWWYHTDPADPADSGESRLIYIEELDDEKTEKLKREYKLGIIDIINELSLDDLKRLKEYIEVYY